ncbi:hypothetical protein BXZ70DRAFT_914975 [Cristinia sonorae]|uniref:Fe2OG dioxygenase domain-containing protein n=1 Tax=Cristinia sonorae TaxID=1940300 RepID=A0A8K0UZ83_9AGAR|nr:hypothetical protein BXZ70DRAFT_914975 [Cristinia sonorae]
MRCTVFRVSPRNLRVDVRRRTPASAPCYSTGILNLKDLSFHPNVFNDVEQKILLSASLQKLDDVESRQFRRRRKEFLANNHGIVSQVSNSPQSWFFPDEYYNFEQGHYDGVIRNFREMHVSTWPDLPELEPLLDRLRALHPQEPTQTHILHLASDGEILPHVDNVEASGSWILGVSLGATRTMRLRDTQDPQDIFEFALPSGSVYLQRDSTRYSYEHSILKGNGGQRLSIMVRNRR